MFSVIQPVAETAGDPVPDWSGELVEMNDGLAIMRVHVSDKRQHMPPPGWRAIGHDTFLDGSLEVYIFFKVSAE